MPSIPPVKRCTSYVAGHTVHWIQALHTANKPEVAARTRSGTLVAIDGPQLTVRFGDVDERFLNHDPDRLAAIAGALPCPITLNDQYRILRVGTYCFSVAPAERGLDPCPTDEVGDDSAQGLVDRLRTHGGFTVRVRPPDR